LSTDTRYGASGGNNARNASEPIELPTDCDLPTLAAPWSETEIRKKREELQKLQKEIATIIEELEEKRKAAKANGTFDRSRQQQLRKLSQQANELEFQPLTTTTPLGLWQWGPSIARWNCLRRMQTEKRWAVT
jgi:hypothetical protein